MRVRIALLLHVWMFSCGVRASFSTNKLLIVSFDGFRADYLQLGITPNLQAVIDGGAHCRAMRPVFPSKTFTNHFSIATGLYAESHGVTGPNLHDWTHGEEPVEYGQALFTQRDWIEPLWIANQRMGGQSGVLMWTGGQFQYGNRTADKFMKYRHTIGVDEKINQAVRWLLEPNGNLVMLYFDEPDFDAHIYAPGSPETLAMIRRTDATVERIMRRLRDEPLLHDRTNVVFVSDHGMSTTLAERFVNLTAELWPDAVRTYGSSPVLQLVPRRANETQLVLQRLRRAAKRLGHFSVYANDELPERWHLRRNKERVGPITAVADIGYAFEDMFEMAAFYERTYNVTRSPHRPYGIHGYDNAEQQMQALFVASGPLIRSGVELAPFENVQLFGLFWRLLGYWEDSMPPTNGTRDGQLLWDAILLDTTDAVWDEDYNRYARSVVIASYIFVVVLGALSLQLTRVLCRRFARQRRNGIKIDHNPLIA